MDISPACSPPSQPAVTDHERAHPRFAEYLTYRNSSSRLLTTCMSFDRWLENTLKVERGYSVVFHTLPEATLAQGWYKHKFAPGTSKMTRFGPFATEHQAKQSGNPALSPKDREQLRRWLASGASLADVEDADRIGMIGNERYSYQAVRAYKLLWTWGAARFGGSASLKQNRFYERLGMDALQRRIARCRAIGARLAI